MQFKLLAATLAAAALLGCATDAPAPIATTQAVPAPVTQYFLAMPETGRLWVFGDAKNYLDFISHGEVQLTRTRIAAGPQGQTVVFGMTGDDVKANQPSAGEQLFDGKVTPAGAFYGEVFRGGRYLVFGEWADMQDYLKHGEVILTHTRVGEGPKGETVVYALNKKTVKDGAPMKLVAQFKALHGVK